MMYGKIENGNFKLFTGISIRYNKRVYVHPPVEIMLAAGWKIVVEDEMPEDKEGYYIEREFEEDETHIYIRYVFVPLTDIEE